MGGTKMFAFFAFCFVSITILCGAMEGVAGINAKPLTSAIDDVVVIIPVESTEGFAGATYPASQRYIIVDNEVISYTGLTVGPSTFTGAVRGSNHPRTGRTTNAATHETGAMVMNVSTSAMNNMIGGVMYAESAATFGTFVALVASMPFWDAVGQALMWDYSFFTGQLIILRYILLITLTGGFFFAMTMAMLSLAQGLFRR